MPGFLSDPEDVTIYPTYGYEEEGRWVIPIRLWVHEKEPRVEKAAGRLIGGLAELDDAARANFTARIRSLVADCESREAVELQFDGDASDAVYRVRGDDGSFPRTDLNGLVEGTLSLSSERAAAIAAAQDADDGWLTLRAVSEGHAGSGRVRLLPPTGRAVVSDVDDTIKVTEIPAGKEIVIHNTFFRDFVAAPGMKETYDPLADASFHYVSGGPWQLFEVLHEFLIGNAGFPEGSFHMKNVRENLLELDSWRDLYKLAFTEATFEQKVGQISELMERFRGRRFILIGDSGEKDPEVFREIRDRFGEQVEEIRIRDVVDARTNDARRLAGMTIIEAETIRPGMSVLGD